MTSSHIATHVSITPHDPVDFMGMPVSSNTMNQYEVDKQMDAILSIDTSKGNNIIKHRGIGDFSHGYARLYFTRRTGFSSLTGVCNRRCNKDASHHHTRYFSYDNGVYHFNSIMQPHIATHAHLLLALPLRPNRLSPVVKQVQVMKVS